MCALGMNAATFSEVTPPLRPAAAFVKPRPDNSAHWVQALRVDDNALDGIMSEWQRPLFAFAWRYLHNRADAEDVVIQTFVRLHEQRHRLREDTNLSAWLFTTLSNLCHNQHRWRRRHPETSFDAPATEAIAPAAPRANIPSTQIEDDETSSVVRAAVEDLPHDQKTVVLLHHYEHLSYREIAAVVGCSERGVETRLYRARQALREILKPLLRELSSAPAPKAERPV
jgi:RNA polymerase sigma-70 factor, ECF subfamily